ncbi:MAG TPA: ATP-binding protein [Gemmatimonadaceae bacterium]|nr:ATP-binding protein [Gemmatimonadaceae bacterium]
MNGIRAFEAIQPGTLLEPYAVTARRGAVVVAIVFVASALTLLCGEAILYERFALFYLAVVAAAVYAGAPAGMFATIAGILVVTYEWLPPRGSVRLADPEIFSVVAFTVVGLAVTALASLFRARAQLLRAAHDAAVASEQRNRLLAEAGRVLSSSLDYEATVALVAQRAVPDFADWCAVDLVVDGRIKRLAVAHLDPAKVRWARSLEDKFPRGRGADLGIDVVIRTGEPRMVREVTDDMLERMAVNADHLAAMRLAGVYSIMIVPMATRGMILGSLMLISSRPERRFDEADFATAQALARRAAVAIDNARLYCAAREANEAKANFLATISHELRTPLTAIIGFDQLLADGISGPVSDGQKQPLERIKANAIHLRSLVEEMLLFARLESNEESVHVEPVRVKHVVDDVVDSLSPIAAQNRLALRAEPADPALTIRSDATKLRQMLVSLVSNAVKFTQRGEVVVRTVDHDGAVTFEIRDTGVGIAPDDLEHVFDPFWQVDQTRTRRTGGSGLGLAVARRIARLMGGDITGESTPSVGSTFRITLPKNSRSHA